MSTPYEIELSEPQASKCSCCDGLVVRMTRFVSRHQDAFAVYYAKYSNLHPANQVSLLISLGEWGEDSDPSQRVAFHCLVRITDTAYEVALEDASDPLWKDAAFVGRHLSREAALRHRWKATVFEVLDEAFARDPSLCGFLHRVRCGNAAIPLERNFQLPDAVAALGDDRDARTRVDGSFVVLDSTRFFIRCLLPIPVEHYGFWSVGLWIEVSQGDFNHALTVWNDPDEYPKLHFSGSIANEVATDLDLPIAWGARVELHVTDADQAPRIAASTDRELSSVLSTTWSQASFEQYAVSRGFL